MPIITGTLSYIAVCIGSNIFNNIAANRNNEEIQRLNREAQEAASDDQKELMWKLLRESQDATVQMEREKQEDRIKDIQSQVDDLLNLKANAMATQSWPLRVPPIVMTNQTVGNIVANTSCENITLHCIITPSNCEDFDKHVLPHIETELESHFNKYWATNSSHPVLFYGSSWRTGEPTRVDIKSLSQNLRSLPTLVINPHFGKDENLTFIIDMWGLTNESKNNSFNVEIIPDRIGEEQRFQRRYTKNVFRGEDGKIDVAVVKECVEDLTPYLECLIGYIVDDYFWVAFGLAPNLPYLISSGLVNTDGMRYLIDDSKNHYKDFFNNIFQNIEESDSNPDSAINPITTVPQLAEYLISANQLLSKEERKDLNQRFIDYNHRYIDGYNDIESIKDYWLRESSQVASIQMVPLEEYDVQNIPIVKLSSLDLSTIILDFKNHISEISDRFDSTKLSLYIAEQDYEYYTFLMCDSESHQVIDGHNRFARRYFTNNTSHLKNIKSLFRFKNKYSIICKESNIDKLIAKITNSDLKF